MDPGPQRAEEVVRNIDTESFNWQVFFVNASGFLASSYSLFATNVIKPALYFVYPPCGRLGPDAGLVIDEVTLVGTALGMLFAGHFADLWGRKKLYGLELVILISATIGVMQTSEGFLVSNPDGTYRHSIDFWAAITWWRFFLGIGIGAEETVIAAEWSPTKSRGRMLAAVYAMQAVARLLAPLIGLAALRIASASHGIVPDAPDDDSSRLVIDLFWRVVTGIAIVPAAFAVVLRRTIPETPRYYADIRRDAARAMRKYLKLYKRKKQPLVVVDKEVTETTGGEKTFWYRGAWRYLRSTPALKNLTVISILWLIMDISWYGLSMESPSALSTLWHDPSIPTRAASNSDTASTLGSRAIQDVCPEYDDWRTDPGNPDITISRVLENNATRSLLVVSIGSLLGNIALVVLIDRFRRKRILMTTFILQGLLFAITGGTLLGTYEAHKNHLVTTVFFGIMHFVFTVGPKTIILVLAVEMFPTAYRGTFYGIAAAVGKIGAIIIRGVIGWSGNGEVALGRRLLGFVGLMFLAAAISCLLPDVQHLPREAGHEVEEGVGSSVSDGASATGSETDGPRGVRVRRSGWRGFMQRLENKTLEEIAPSLTERGEGGGDVPMQEAVLQPHDVH
ncbi:major facilitator superfamily domain-containing protein [Podospora appendiculata]|uniref:Major facilitator superfamily domain-containing protein n=1 Tax=Podospora appendiculata TaxID=314037 RepID=A0AAE1CE65_9PEZI|nr:major facilitator superfamily domain-containing protein [Podospora appendiculata]